MSLLAGRLFASGIDSMRHYEERRIRKERRLRVTILVCLAVIGILTWLETRVFDLGPVPLPVSGNVLVFVLININVLLLLLVVFLVLRKLAHLIFERRLEVLGARLRTKLVIAFVSFSLIPTGLLFFVALQFVSTSMDYWFNTNVEESLVTSLEIAKGVYHEAREKALADGQATVRALKSRGLTRTSGEAIRKFLAVELEKRQLAGLLLVDSERSPLAQAIGQPLKDAVFPEIPNDFFQKTLAGGQGEVIIQEVPGGEFVRGVVPVRLEADGGAAVLVTSVFIPGDQLKKMQTISRGLEGYRQLILLKSPIKTSIIMMLLIVTLLIIFAAIWFGFYMAGSLTGPMGRLAEATRRIAEGDLDFVLEKQAGDEMGMLVDAFNQMTSELRASHEEVGRASAELQRSYRELDRRRRYTESVLENITAGVISLDPEGNITTINRFAAELLKVERNAILGRRHQTVLRAAHLSILEGLLNELTDSGTLSIQRPLRITIGPETFFIRVNLVRLEDESGVLLGVVLVFDNLTELEKAQRMAAWREVARRIAHEVKNPLTPIQLSAQRLRKKYLERLGADAEVFDKCTQTIVSQVEELKRLVGEFSSFARMPALRKTVGGMESMARETLVLFQEAHGNIEFNFILDGEVPAFAFDRDQMKRVLMNLLDNAVAVLPDGGGIDVRLSNDKAGRKVVLEVADSGPGISDADKPRLFEPYYSTKKTGTGLGLAITSTIVADHGGTIRVEDRKPQGSRFIVDLPVGDG